MVWGYPCEWGPVQKHKTDAGAKDAVMSRLFSFFASAVEGVVPESEAQKRSWQDVWNPPPPSPSPPADSFQPRVCDLRREGFPHMSDHV